MKFRLSALTCALSCLVPLPVLADTPTVVSDITTLDAMVITGSKEAQAVGDTPAAISKSAASASTPTSRPSSAKSSTPYPASK